MKLTFCQFVAKNCGEFFSKVVFLIVPIGRKTPIVPNAQLDFVVITDISNVTFIKGSRYLRPYMPGHCSLSFEEPKTKPSVCFLRFVGFPQFTPHTPQFTRWANFSWWVYLSCRSNSFLLSVLKLQSLCWHFNTSHPTGMIPCTLYLWCLTVL